MPNGFDTAQVPEEAAFWSEADLEAYFGSNGRALTAKPSFAGSLLGQSRINISEEDRTRQV